VSHQRLVSLSLNPFFFPYFHYIKNMIAGPVTVILGTWEMEIGSWLEVGTSKVSKTLFQKQAGYHDAFL
jgi:hypothetical protein